MVQINVRVIEKQLLDANLPREEISIVVHNFEALESARLSDNDIQIVVHNIVDDTNFRALFINTVKGHLGSHHSRFSVDIFHTLSLN